MLQVQQKNNKLSVQFVKQVRWPFNLQCTISSQTGMNPKSIKRVFINEAPTLLQLLSASNNLLVNTRLCDFQAFDFDFTVISTMDTLTSCDFADILPCMPSSTKILDMIAQLSSIYAFVKCMRLQHHLNATNSRNPLQPYN